MRCPAFIVVGGKEYRCQRLHRGHRATHRRHEWWKAVEHGGLLTLTWTAEVTRREVDEANAGRPG